MALCLTAVNSVINLHTNSFCVDVPSLFAALISSKTPISLFWLSISGRQRNISQSSDCITSTTVDRMLVLFLNTSQIMCGVRAHNLSQCWQTILDVLDIHGIRCLACILLQLLVLRFDSLFKSSSMHSNWSLKFTIATITIHRLWNWLA